METVSINGLGQMAVRGRPKSPMRRAAELARAGGGTEETMRTSIDRMKAMNVLSTVLPQPFDNSLNAWAEIRAKWPRFFRGERLRVTVLRHLYPLAHWNGFDELMTAFHDSDLWTTAREGEELAKRLVAAELEALTER